MSEFKKTSLRRVARRVGKREMILGYTRAGRPVFRPMRRTSDKVTFTDWARGEHRDAARILLEHSEREPDPKIAAWCAVWSRVHWDLGGRETN